MNIGIQIIQQRDPLHLAELGRKAEAAGFDALWLAGGGDNYIKASILLGATTRIAVGTSIVPTLHASPALHATVSGYLAEAFQGRFILGFGSQTKGQVRQQLGFDPPKIAKMSREVIEVTRGILSGQPFEYEGEFYSRNAAGRVRANPEAPPPIYYSGVGPMNLRIAGQYSDGFLAHPIFTRKYYEDVVWPEIDNGLRRSGRTRAEFQMVAMPMTLIVHDESERASLMSAAKRNLANYFTTRAYGTFMDMNGWSKQREAIQEVAARAGRVAGKFDYQALEECVTDDMVDAVCLVGTAEEVRQRALERYDGIADALDFYPMHDGADAHDVAQEKEREIIRRFIAAFEGLNT